jgi:type II secretory pathway component PulF
MMVTWVWTRLYILPYLIWFLARVLVPQFFSQLEEAAYFVPYIQAMNFFLGCLALLHYWWFYLIGQMLLTVLF